MKSICLILCFSWFCPWQSSGQRPEQGPGEAPDSLHIWEPVNLEKSPSFPGGEPALLSFWVKRFAVPQDCPVLDDGRIVVSFVVEINGELSQIEMLKLAHPCLEPAMRAVFVQMPCWTPGEWAGQPRRTRMVWPLRIRWE